MMRNTNDATNTNRSLAGPLGYLAVILWFLMTVLAPMRVQAEIVAPAPATPAPVASSTAAMEPFILDALIAEGASADAEIIITSENTPFALAHAGAAPIVETASYNEASGRFLVRLRGIENGPVLAIAGTARAASRFPVLARPVTRGEIIEAQDIDYIETATLRASAYILDEDELIGKKARRPIAAGAPMKKTDVAALVLIKKGALVTMVYETRGLRLMQTGVALDKGGAGDVVSIRNVESERIIKAIVVSENRVAVAGSRPFDL